MSQAGRFRRELEMLWQTRLEQAAKRHGMAAVRCLRVMEEYGPSCSFDGQAAILRAIRQADAARLEHSRVLGIFADLLAIGKLSKSRANGLVVIPQLAP